jgi:hypothetical protein
MMTTGAAASASEAAEAAVRGRILAVFAMQGIILATLNMRIPDLQLRDSTTLSLA